MSAQESNSINVNGEVILELGKYGGPIFLGRSDGANMRQKFGLDDLDKSDQTVHVIFPQNTKGVGSSFFLAMFGMSIRNLGSAEEFAKKFRFSGPDFVVQDLIPTSVERALFEGGLFGDNDLVHPD